MKNSVFTEKTVIDGNKRSGWIFYDGKSYLCREMAERSRDILEHYGYDLLPLETPCFRDLFGVSSNESERKVGMYTFDGQYYGGWEVLVHLSREIGNTFAAWFLVQLPGIPVGMWRRDHAVGRHRFYFGNGWRRK